MPIFALAIAVMVERQLERRGMAILACAAIVVTALTVVLMYSFWHGYITFDNANPGTILDSPGKLQAEF